MPHLPTASTVFNFGILFFQGVFFMRAVGESLAMVSVHGIKAHPDSTAFTNLTREIGKELGVAEQNIVRVHLPAHGVEPDSRESFNANEAMKRVADEITRQVNAGRRVVLLGHSGGGTTGMGALDLLPPEIRRGVSHVALIDASNQPMEEDGAKPLNTFTKLTGWLNHRLTRPLVFGLFNIFDWHTSRREETRFVTREENAASSDARRKSFFTRAHAGAWSDTNPWNAARELARLPKMIDVIRKQENGDLIPKTLYIKARPTGRAGDEPVVKDITAELKAAGVTVIEKEMNHTPTNHEAPDPTDGMKIKRFDEATEVAKIIGAFVHSA
jgi:pimeloyl-ACP methyl ester carboxylesterase